MDCEGLLQICIQLLDEMVQAVAVEERLQDLVAHIRYCELFLILMGGFKVCIVR